MDKQSKSFVVVRVDRLLLTKFISSYLNEYRIPPLQQFLHIKNTSGPDIYVNGFKAGPSISVPAEVTAALDKEALLWVQSGVLELWRGDGSKWRREIEYKEGAFFTNVNFRNLGPL